MAQVNLNRVKGKISICALAYNHYDYLDDFFKGVLNQRLDNYQAEVIIGIDKCADKTAEKCIEYRDRFPAKIKLLVHPHHVGLMGNFASVLASADGEYIAFCECDDYWIDEYKLLAQVALLEQDSNTGICFTNIRILNSGKGTLEKNWATITKQKYSLSEIISNNIISNCSVLMKNNIDSVLLDHLRKFEVGDWPLYILSMYKDGSHAVFLDKITSVYRHHEGGFYSTQGTVQRLKITNKVYISLLQILGSSGLKKLITKELAKNFYSLGIFEPEKVAARKNYIFSIKQFNLLNVKFPFFSMLRLFRSFL